MGIQLGKRGILISMSPRALYALTRQPQTHVVLLLIGLHGVILIFLLGRELIDITEFKEATVRILTVGIVCNALQATIQQRATHDVQVARQRVHNLHQILCVGIVCRLTQRIVQNFVEASTHQLLANEVSQLMLLVFVALNDEA